MLSVLEKAKANGAKIIAVNPLPEAGFFGSPDVSVGRGSVWYGPVAGELGRTDVI